MRNLLAVTALTEFGTGLDLGLSGIALWPAVSFHAAMTAWCVTCLATSRL